MSALIDLTGQRFERLIVLQQADKSATGKTLWLCQCDCGNTTIASRSNLVSGDSKSCGCLNLERLRDRLKDLTGQIFGRLTVLNKDPKSTLQKTKWLCQCECGQQKSVRGSHLKSGKSKSCGCLNKEMASERGHDLTGQKFGKLIVLTQTKNRTANGAVRWSCHCECGSTKPIVGRNLVSGNTQSCGCTQSQPESDLLQYIQSLGFPEARKTREVIRSAKGKVLELDVYVESKQIAFEYCGLHWHGELCNQEHARSKHIQKLRACTQAGIALITVFADEWLTRNGIVRDRIAALLGLGHVSIGARKCKIQCITPEATRGFTDKYHLQGGCKSSVDIALCYQDELVAVGSFKKSSKKFKKSDSSIWELVRYTLKSGYRVQGGLSKILAEFKKLVPECKQILSFADRRWSTGKLYAACGFRLDKVTPPDYRYFKKGYDFPRIHKFNMRRAALIKKYGCDPAQSEWQMAQSAGFDRIWDCGLEKWVLDVLS